MLIQATVYKMQTFREGGLEEKHTLNASITDSSPLQHTHTLMQSQHIHTSSALLLLFPPLHIHVDCVSITAWYHILFHQSDKIFCPSTSLLLVSLLLSHVFHLSIVCVDSVPFIRAHS